MMYELTDFIPKDMKVDVAPEVVEYNLDNVCGKLSRSSLVVRYALSPLEWLMKVCGMTYGSSCPMMTKIGLKHKIQRAYTIFVVIMICIACVRFIPLFFTCNKCPKFIMIEYFVWHFKCMVQELYCVFMCCRYGREVSRLQGLIWEYDMLLLSYKHSMRKVEEKFTKRCRTILGILFFVLLICFANVAYSYFGPNANTLVDSFFHPFKPSVFSRLFYMILTMYCSVAWLLPVILYCILCLALCLVFDQFCSCVESIQCTSVKSRISYIRAEYIKLQKISACTDDAVGFMAFCVYFLDVVLFCFHMYHLIYFAKDAQQRIPPAFWTLVSVCNLFFMSLSASKVVDKGQQIYSYVSKMDTKDIDLESHAQLMMLLQDMAIDPPALTVWKLIPLYKSIVVSVFVSLITYFTLLIQFKL